MEWLFFFSYIILFIVAIAAWSNTKILLEEIKEIKKHLGIAREQSPGAQDASINPEEWIKPHNGF